MKNGFVQLTDPCAVDGIVDPPKLLAGFRDHVVNLLRIGDVDFNDYGAVLGVRGDGSALGGCFLGGDSVHVCEGDAGGPLDCVEPSAC